MAGETPPGGRAQFMAARTDQDGLIRVDLRMTPRSRGIGANHARLLRHALAYVLLFGVAIPLWIAGLLIAAPILLAVKLVAAVITTPIQALRSW